MDHDHHLQTGSTLHVLLRDPANPQAWSAFVDRYGPQIYRWCRRWKLQDADAQDLTQTVLAKLVRVMRMFTYDPQKRFRGWLKRVTHNAWIDWLEERNRTGTAVGGSNVRELLDSTAARDDLAKTLDEEYRSELLEEAKARVQLRVSPRDWKVFRALALEGRTGKEVAAEHQTTVAAVFMAKSRVQHKLKKEVRRLDGAWADQREKEV